MASGARFCEESLVNKGSRPHLPFRSLEISRSLDSHLPSLPLHPAVSSFPSLAPALLILVSTAVARSHRGTLVARRCCSQAHHIMNHRESSWLCVCECVIRDWLVFLFCAPTHPLHPHKNTNNNVICESPALSACLHLSHIAFNAGLWVAASRQQGRECDAECDAECEAE